MKKNLRTFLAPMIALALVLGTSAGRAALANGDFETSPAAGGLPSGWTGFSGTVGTYVPTIGTGNQYPGGLSPAAGNVAYINASGNIYQNFSMSLTAGDTLEISIAVGSPNGSTFGTPYINLNEDPTGVAGTGTPLTPSPISTATPDSGSFVTWTIDYAVGADGTALQIVLGNSTGSASQVDFDNVVITAVPEPVNVALALFGIVAVGGIAGRHYLGRRRLATAS